MEKFNWGGNGATLIRLRRSKLLLPTNKKTNPITSIWKTI